jgi:hypothetical protein
MAPTRSFFQLQTRSGPPIVVGDVRVTPQARALAIRWPGGGWVWNRPVGVLVERDGETDSIPILDLTRVARWSMLGLALAFVAFAFLRSRARGRDEHE